MITNDTNDNDNNDNDGFRELSFLMLGTGVEEYFIQIAKFSFPIKKVNEIRYPMSR